MLHIIKEPYYQTTFPQVGCWDITKLPTSLAERIVTSSIAVPPPGKHDVSLCESYERSWRLQASKVITHLTGSECVCLMWATGPILWDGLPRVLNHSLDQEMRYHIESETSDSDVGYLTSWFSFEYREKYFTSLMEDEEADLEYTRLQALILEQGIVGDVLTKPFQDIGLVWIMKHGVIGLSSFSHFEGIYIVGDNSVVQEAVSRVQRNLGKASA